MVTLYLTEGEKQPRAIAHWEKLVGKVLKLIFQTLTDSNKLQEFLLLAHRHNRASLSAAKCRCVAELEACRSEIANLLKLKEDCQQKNYRLTKNLSTAAEDKMKMQVELEQQIEVMRKRNRDLTEAQVEKTSLCDCLSKRVDQQTEELNQKAEVIDQQILDIGAKDKALRNRTICLSLVTLVAIGIFAYAVAARPPAVSDNTEKPEDCEMLIFWTDEGYLSHSIDPNQPCISYDIDSRSNISGTVERFEEYLRKSFTSNWARHIDQLTSSNNGSNVEICTSIKNQAENVIKDLLPEKLVDILLTLRRSKRCDSKSTNDLLAMKFESLSKSIDSVNESSRIRGERMGAIKDKLINCTRKEPEEHHGNMDEPGFGGLNAITTALQGLTLSTNGITKTAVGSTAALTYIAYQLIDHFWLNAPIPHQPAYLNQ
jgi:hypothetical protein